jgi:hypothetical protein
MRLNMNHITLTQKSILAAACFCFATSLTAQTAGRPESTSLKDTTSATEPQIVASLSHPASVPGMPLTDPGTLTSPADHSSAASLATPISPAGVDTPQAKLLASALLPASASLSAATAVRWSAVTPVAAQPSSRKSWVSVERGTLPPAPLYEEAPSANPYGPAPAFVNLGFGHK